MGDSLPTRNMKVLFLVLAVVSCVAADADFSSETALFSEFAPEENLLTAAKQLHVVSQAHEPVAVHADRILKHAELIQSSDAESKAKAYVHNYKKAKAAIKAATKALMNELHAGHRHDKNALNQGKNFNARVISNAHKNGKNKSQSYKHKTCPAKRHEEEARAAKAKAKSSMHSIENSKVCPVATTWGDMDIDKSRPKYGRALRSKWDTTRAKYVKATHKYNAAKKAHERALKAYQGAIASFHTALKIEAANAHNACRNAHKEYNVLKKSVASNVATRKQVYIALLVVNCYVDNMTSNGAARSFADKARRKSTSMWNIRAPGLPGCPSKAHLVNQFGPSSWRPSRRTCSSHHWHGKRGVLSCATRTAASNDAGVVNTPAHGGYTMTGGGLNNRYRHWNARSAFEESYPYGNQWRCDTGFGPGQLTCYVRACKTNVGGLTCTTRSSRKNGSGTVQVNAPGGYQMTGCGLYNHYRHWNAHALFERIHPNGNGCLGDMGAGYGQFTVYTRACKAPSGYTLSCKNVNTGRANYHAANCPGGYTMTGCGIQNYYGGWNAKSGIENVAQPHGNGCLCDSGFGTGDNMCFARCCKLV